MFEFLKHEKFTVLNDHVLYDLDILRQDFRASLDVCCLLLLRFTTTVLYLPTGIKIHGFRVILRPII